jgi:putative PIN family toxin of toxin-antitoxin system
MRIVLDTNVLISALIKEGKSKRLLSEILQNHELVISKEILEEVAVTANKPRLQKYIEQENIADFLRDLASSASIIRIRSRFKVIDEDPVDDVMLRTGNDGKASFVVSGDIHLLDIGRFRRIRIVTVSEMLDVLKDHSP